MGWFKRIALKHVYYLGWNRSPAQVGCMRQALRPGARGRPRGSGWRGRWEGGSGWGTHVNPWLFHFNIWQNSLQKKKKKTMPCVTLPCGKRQGWKVSPKRRLSRQRTHLKFRKHRRRRFHPRVGKIPWRRKRQPTPVFLSGESHGQRILAGYSSWGRKESDTTERPSRLGRKSEEVTATN